ncbi:hypothetical protein Nepgr_022207 [Nepenthes gracilis]|uniref:BHLH domain-containing protein n=1 Tax=Nepenthes gracilis TaxID=150966 RepID=A0AAD3T0D8_NEPGR|nr:hypothetical protein Nepgr_022207 [Nepenthes gracilis]
MQSDRQYYPREVVLPLENLVDAGDMQNSSAASAFAADLPLGLKHSGAVHCAEFQPSEICPKKFIIFDRTHDRSQIMFHPMIGEKLSYDGLELNASCYGDNIDRNNANYEQKEISCLFNDNLNEIDALLSFDDEVEDSDEEEVSSANTHGDDGSRSLDSFSNNSSKSRKIKHPSSSQKSSDCGGRYDEQKRKKLQKMIQVLRGIVPGGDQMNTVAILDAAVRYLKSLKVEAQNLGVANLKNYA